MVHARKLRDEEPIARANQGPVSQRLSNMSFSFSSSEDLSLLLWREDDLLEEDLELPLRLSIRREVLTHPMGTIR